MQIEIWSDVVCPWCYIGKRRLERALGEFEHADEVEVTWRSFQLNPDTPPGTSVPTLDYLAQRFGPQAQAMTARVAEMGKGEGLTLDFASSLTVTDIATGWTEVRTVRNKAARHVFCALVEIQAALPFPLLGIDSDNGSEFINEHLLAWCLQQQITFTRSRPQNKNDGCHVEQKNWDITRRTVGYWRYDTPGEIELLNRIWPVLSPLINLFTPQQKLQSKTRVGAKVSKRYDRAQTPYQRLLTHAATNPAVLDQADTRRLATLLEDTNPAAARRDIARLCATPLERVRRKTVTRRAKTNRAYLSGTKTRRADGSLIISTPKRAKPHESTTQHKRAS